MGNGRNVFEKWEMGGNDWEWVAIVNYGREWLGMVVNVVECVGMVRNGRNGWEWWTIVENG